MLLLMTSAIIPEGFKDDVTTQVATEHKFMNMIIDNFIVNGVPKKINNLSDFLKNSSTGYLYHYAFCIVLSLVVILGIILARSF